MLQVLNFIKIPLPNPKLFVSVLLNVFYFITGNGTELFHLVKFILRELLFILKYTILKILFVLNRIQVFIPK